MFTQRIFITKDAPVPFTTNDYYSEKIEVNLLIPFLYFDVAAKNAQLRLTVFSSKTPIEDSAANTRSC